MLLLKTQKPLRQSTFRLAALNRRRTRQKGISVFVFGFCLATIVPVVGLAVDLSMMYLAQTRLSSAADSASLAAARGLSRGIDNQSQKDQGMNVANAYMEKNFPTGVYQSTGTWNHGTTDPGSGPWSSTTIDTAQANIRVVTTNASATLPTMFMRYVGPNTMTIHAMAQVTRRDINVMMVLDRSGSMNASGSCTPMKAAAAAFVGQFSPGRDYVGLVTFSTDAQLNNPASQNFTAVTTSINNIVCGGSTNTTQALMQAYRELIHLNSPNALNVVLLFTDGQPTVTPINSFISGTSTCPAAWRNTWRTGGVIGGSTNTNGSPLGFFDAAATVTDQVYPLSTGCSYASSQWNIANDVTTVATTDQFSNSVNVPSGTVGTYRVVPANPAINWANMIGVAENTSYQAARLIRTGGTVTPVVPTSTGTANSLTGVYIFTIGLGTAAYPVNLPFLKDLANDLNAQNYTAPVGGVGSQNTGLFVDAPTVAELNPSFQRVASQILRLSR